MASENNVFDVVRSSHYWRCEEHKKDRYEPLIDNEVVDTVLHTADDFDTASRHAIPHRRCGCAIFIRIRSAG